MHEPYEDDDYDDHDYDDQKPYDPYKFYFKFDVGPGDPISNWIYDMINKWIGPNDINSLDGLYDLGIGNVPGFPVKKFPVNSWNPNTGKGNTYQYLGSNYQGSPIWKYKHFVSNKLNIDYLNHLQAHAVHFIQQPTYYKGMFDILN